MNLEDRELLEMAAKAAGISGHWLELDAEFKLDSPVISDGTKRYLWRPLQDDGDALRLAVALRMTLICSNGHTACDVPGTDEWVSEEAIHGEAARRAIVRAAAEIGKAMQEKH